MVAKFIVRFLAASTFCFSLALAAPTAHIKNGTIQGTVQSTKNGRDYFAFQGIPYALPPVGELRFKEPQPADAWSDILIADKDGKLCIQRDFLEPSHEIVGSEDCLYLNVYVPKSSEDDGLNTDKKYPVMVWIHGGAFVGGSGYSKLYGPGYLLDNDVILVTINYRLGVLGFLSTEDLTLPGNFGMKDQVHALRWVNENIGQFGGDENSVTLFGESAGGVSTHFHMISPLSRGLFHRVISQSGTVMTSWALYRPGAAKKHAKRLGELLDCPIDDSASYLDCMRGKNAVDIVAQDEHFRVLGIDPLITLKPAIEPDHPGAFLKDEPIELFRTGRINDVPWLTGINSHEGSLRVMYLFNHVGERNSIEKLDREWDKYGLVSLLIDDTCPEEFQAEVSNKIREFYFGDNNITRSMKEELINMYSDAWFNVGTHDSVKTHLKTFKSPVYYYHFAYRGRYSFSNILDLFGDYGVNHGDELSYLFPIGIKFFFDMFEPPRSSEDLRMVKVMTTMWYNFAKTGKPTPEVTEILPEEWLPVESEELEYYEIRNSADLKMTKNLNSERIKFWDSIPHRGKIVDSSNDLRTEL